MTSHTLSGNDRSLRDSVRFYLLDHRTPVGKAIDVALLVLDLVFVATYVAQTYPVSETAEQLLWRLEVGIVAVFVVEYALRLYGAEDRIAEALDAYTLIDLATILPTLSVVALSATVAPIGIGFLRVLGVVRVLRFYRFTRDEEFFFGTVSVGRLRAARLLFTVLSLFFIFAGVFYGVEHSFNPEVATYGDAFYFVVVTLTTVGFGDVTPVTKLGRWVTVTAILTGIILIPWQARRIVVQWVSEGRVDTACPGCGLATHDADAEHCKACGHALEAGREPRTDSEG